MRYFVMSVKIGVVVKFDARTWVRFCSILIAPIDSNHNRTNIEIDTDFGNTLSGFFSAFTRAMQKRFACLLYRCVMTRYGWIGMFVAYLLCFFFFISIVFRMRVVEKFLN